MSKKNDKKFGNSQGHGKRRINTRDERKIHDIVPKIVFSFRDFKHQSPGQSWKDWKNNGLLAELMAKLVHLSEMTMAEAKTNGLIGIYEEFPSSSDFVCPDCFPKNTNWASIKHIKGQKGRVAGHIVDNVFYVVFLDKDHVFYKTKSKKNR